MKCTVWFLIVGMSLGMANVGLAWGPCDGRLSWCKSYKPFYLAEKCREWAARKSERRCAREAACCRAACPQPCRKREKWCCCKWLCYRPKRCKCRCQPQRCCIPPMYMFFLCCQPPCGHCAPAGPVCSPCGR